jgi:predicted PurR-regulated permease PerM
MPEKDIRNPFQSEEDAFRILVMIIAAAVIVIACAVLISTTLGAILAAIAIAIGLWRSAGWLKVMLGAPDEEDPPAP